MTKFFNTISLGILSGLVSTAAANEVERPNIIIILADDLGYGDCGAFNAESKIKTPHIDQMAKESMRFTGAHAASATCTPSRYGLLTGINPTRTGVRNTLLRTGRPIIEKEELTLAQFLKSQGYMTMMIGKWHLGFEKSKKNGKAFFDFSKELRGGPLDRGFDYFYGIHSSAGSSPLFYIKGRGIEQVPTRTIEVNKIKAEGQSISTRVEAAKDYFMEEVGPKFCADALRQIKDYAESKKEKPFFMYYASPAPHQPWVPSKEFKNKSQLGLYGDSVMQLDDELGQINQALKDTGLDENTLLIFMSDNGTGPGAHTLMADQGHQSSAHLRGSKASSFEGGHRIPFILKWPGNIEANSQNKAIVNGTDLFATLADLLKVDLKDLYPKAAADSYSFYPTLIDKSRLHKRPAMVIRDGIRLADWKLISSQRKVDFNKLSPKNFALYNLEKDLGETTDISQANPERVDEMIKEFKDYMSQRQLKEKSF